VSDNEVLSAKAVTVTSKLYTVHNDHLGTPKAMTDETGVKVWSATHTPFGYASVVECFSRSCERVKLNVRFPGQYYDVETGLHYNYFRYYDPGTGRYITSDPIGLAGGLNMFGYVGGNPVNFVDPTGLDYGFSVNSSAAGGNGHTTLYFQAPSSQWYAYNQGSAGSTSSGEGSAGYLLGLDSAAAVTITAVDYPRNASLFSSNASQDARIAQSAVKSLNEHNSGKTDYNLYSNNCTDAAVDVVNNAGVGVNVPNPASTVRPNSWLDIIQRKNYE